VTPYPFLLFVLINTITSAAKRFLVSFQHGINSIAA